MRKAGILLQNHPILAEPWRPNRMMEQIASDFVIHLRDSWCLYSFTVYTNQAFGDKISPLRRCKIRGIFDNQLSKDWSSVGARKIRNKRKIWQSTVERLIERNREKNQNQGKSFDRRIPGWSRIDQGWMVTINWWAQGKFEIGGRSDNQMLKDWLSWTVRKIETSGRVLIEEDQVDRELIRGEWELSIDERKENSK